MPFESLAYRYTLIFDDFPERWLPLIHLYDPDLPLFPIYYFHALRDNTYSRPSEADRVFGYVERLFLRENNNLEVTVITNKDLNRTVNEVYLEKVREEVRERLGLNDPVIQDDINHAFIGELADRNNILNEMWYRTVANSYGNKLPFGRLWDHVLGLTRWVASWYSPSGRKGELIQTHYFVSNFGEPIQSSGDLPRVDFYLLPTIHELSSHNPLTWFPNYSSLVNIAHIFKKAAFSLIEVGKLQISKFINHSEGRFDTKKLLEIINDKIPHDLKHQAKECFNAFDKGPQRTIIFLMMLDDIRNRRISFCDLTSEQSGLIYDKLRGSYQSPKVIQIYAQQCYGNINAIPIDTWIETFFKWPLKLYPLKRISHAEIFLNTRNLGKVERLLWVVGQARKVHSSACDDALWCLKYGSAKGEPRGSNPLACNICLESIRDVCPAFLSIKDSIVSFNERTGETVFLLTTSDGDNTIPNQKFVRCEGRSIYEDILDEFSPVDYPNGYAPFPIDTEIHSMTVEAFVNKY